MPWRSSETTIGMRSPRILRASSAGALGIVLALGDHRAVQAKVDAVDRPAARRPRGARAPASGAAAASIPAEVIAHGWTSATTATSGGSKTSTPRRIRLVPRCRPEVVAEPDLESLACSAGLKVETSWRPGRPGCAASAVVATPMGASALLRAGRLAGAADSLRHGIGRAQDQRVAAPAENRPQGLAAASRTGSRRAA